MYFIYNRIFVQLKENQDVEIHTFVKILRIVQFVWIFSKPQIWRKARCRPYTDGLAVFCTNSKTKLSSKMGYNISFT